jgi:hypothetical protein
MFLTISSILPMNIFKMWFGNWWQGVLAWLYAIPSPNDGVSHPGEASITLFISTRLRDIIVEDWNKMHFSSELIRFPVLYIGKITQTNLLAECCKKLLIE